MSDNLRYEQKMVFDALRLDEVRSWVYAHPDAFRVAYPPRQVNNIYFDTPDRTLMLDHIGGVTNRAKFRFRWYGESWLARDGQIEIKKKIGRLGYKIIQPVATLVDMSKLNWREIMTVLQANCSGEFSDILENLTPAIINQYRREYYVSMDGVVRVTLDYELRAYEQSFGFRPNIRYPQPLRNDVVIEMKAAEKDHQRVADSLAKFLLRCSQNSKYLNGMEFVV